MYTRTDTLFPVTTLFRSLPSVCPEHEGWPDMNAAAIRPAPAARRRPAAGFSCAAATLNLPSMNDVATPGIEASDDISDEALMLAYAARSEEHTSELQSLMRTSYAVFCLKKKKVQP